MFKVDVKFDIEKAIDSPKNAIKRGLEVAGAHILKKANEKVPLDKGDLQTSGKSNANDDIVVIHYNEPYAVRLHENPQYNFQGGREGKWLENTIKDSTVQNDFIEIISKSIKGSLK